METPAKYEVDKPIYPENKRQEVLRSPYFQAIASTVHSMIMAGKLLPGRRKELIEDAIAFTDMLIEKVGQKI